MREQPEPIDLLTTLKDESLYSSAILGTYKFDGQFFEDKVLPTIQDLEITNIVVLTDSKEYETGREINRAGEWYYLDSIRVPGIFHPKFVLLLGHRRGTAMIGSANLTELGWRQNAELATIIKHVEEDPEHQNGDAFYQLKEFIQRISDPKYLASEKTRSAIDAAFQDAPWIPDNISNPSESNVRVIHNVDKSISDQVLEYINTDTHTIDILSPFFGETDVTPLEKLAETGCNELNIFLQPDDVRGFVSESVQQGLSDNLSKQIRKISMAGDDEDRYLHAKLIHGKGDSGTWTLFGSPNLTSAALIETANSGNLELGVIRQETNPEYFDYLLESSDIDISLINSEQIPHKPIERSSTESETDFQLFEAYIDEADNLQVSFEPTEFNRGILHLKRQSDSELFSKSFSDDRNGTIQLEDDEIVDFCQSSTKVYLTLDADEGEITSSERWLSLPTLGKKPRRGEIESIEASNGRYGLLDVLNRLEGMEAMYRFLEGIDFNKITSGKGGVGTVSINGGGEEGGAGIKDREFADYSELIEEKVEKFSDGLEDNEWPEDNQTWEDCLYNLFNLYLGGSKLTLWWIERDPAEKLRLRHIKKATETLQYSVTSMRGIEGEEFTYQVEEDLKLLEHTAIVCYFVNEIQIREGLSSGPNERVYEMFRETSRSALNTFGKARDNPIPSKELLESCLTEYNGIKKNRIPKPNSIRNFVRTLI